MQAVFQHAALVGTLLGAHVDFAHQVGVGKGGHNGLVGCHPLVDDRAAGGGLDGPVSFEQLQHFALACLDGAVGEVLGGNSEADHREDRD